MDMTIERKFDAAAMLGMLKKYETTIGDLFAVVPPLMPRDSVKTADIDGMTLRRISAKDFMDGILMPEDRVEGIELIRVDAAKADRYRLRAGDILMPRILPKHKYADYMVVNVKYAEQDLASSHNMITIRPRAVDMAERERIAYSEMVATYLTRGRGAELIAKFLDVLEGTVKNPTWRPAELQAIDVPPALDYRTPDYAAYASKFMELYDIKRNAQAEYAEALERAEQVRKNVAAVLEKASPAALAAAARKSATAGKVDSRRGDAVKARR